MSKEHDIRYTKVVIGHCDLFLLPSFMKDGFIYKFIYSFHMPLFMLLSGYLSISICKKTIIEIIDQKFKRLIVPSIAGTLLSCFILSVNFAFILNEYWYLKCLFVCSVSYGICYHLTRKFYFLHIILFLLLLLVPFCSLWNIVYMYPFFAIGMIMRKHEFMEKFDKQLWKNKMVITVIFVSAYLILFSEWSGGMSHDYSRFKLLYVYRDNYLYDAYCFIYRVIIGIIASCALYCLIKSIYNNLIMIILQFLGRNSIGVYLIHAYLITLLSDLVIGFPIPRATIIILVATIIVVASVIVTYILSKKQTFSKYLFGQ